MNREHLAACHCQNTVLQLMATSIPRDFLHNDKESFSSRLVLLLQENCNNLLLIILYIIAPLLSHSGFSSITKHKRKTVPLSQMLATLKKIVSYIPQFLVYNVGKDCLKHIPTYSSLVPEKPSPLLRGAEKLHIRNQKAKFRATVTQTTSLLLSGQALVTHCLFHIHQSRLLYVMLHIKGTPSPVSPHSSQPTPLVLHSHAWPQHSSLERDPQRS